MWAAVPERGGRVVATALAIALVGSLAPGVSTRAQERDAVRLAETPRRPPAATNDLDRMVKDLDLSLLHGPLGDSVAVPLGGTRFIRPYAAIGGSLGLARLDDPLDPYRNLSRGGDSTDLAAGFSWRLSDRFQLFGEYRFLSISPDPGSGDSDDQLHWGFSIRF